MLRRLVKGCALFSSGIRKIWVKATNQGVQFGADVFLDSGVRIRVVDGARLIIGDRTTIARGTTIICKEGMLSIGADGFIGERVTLVARDHIEIGADALISSDVTIRDMAHGTERNGVPFRSQPSITKPIAIESNVWLGVGVTVLLGVRIGADSVVGAHAVVNKDVPAGVLAVGVPAGVVRKD